MAINQCIVSPLPPHGFASVVKNGLECWLLEIYSLCLEIFQILNPFSDLLPLKDHRCLTVLFAGYFYKDYKQTFCSLHLQCNLKFYYLIEIGQFAKQKRPSAFLQQHASM